MAGGFYNVLTFDGLSKHQQTEAITTQSQLQQELIRNLAGPQKATYVSGICPGCKAEITSSVCFCCSFFVGGSRRDNSSSIQGQAHCTTVDHNEFNGCPISAALAADEKVYISKDKCDFEPDPDGQKRSFN